MSVASYCYDDQYHYARRGEASCAEPLVAVIYGMASKQKYSSSSEKKRNEMKKNTHMIKVRFVFVMFGGGASLNAKFLASLSVCFRKGLIIAGPVHWHYIWMCC